MCIGRGEWSRVHEICRVGIESLDMCEGRFCVCIKKEVEICLSVIVLECVYFSWIGILQICGLLVVFHGGFFLGACQLRVSVLLQYEWF